MVGAVSNRTELTILTFKKKKVGQTCPTGVPAHYWEGEDNNE